MELLERTGVINQLLAQLAVVAEGEGHCMFISGEAGIGKTSLVKALSNKMGKDVEFFQGSCDALFTPRLLAPLYDILLQLHSDLWKTSSDMAGRTALFSGLFQELCSRKKMPVVVFEDIHWADEATLDFIKFFVRRITRLRCLFLLTYRDDEINASHPLTNVLSQLPADAFTRMQLQPLSRQTVSNMASAKGYDGNDVYAISGGNPFYVTEILASYSAGIPDNIKDAVLSVYNRQNEPIKKLWQILSVLPTGLEIKLVQKMEPTYVDAMESVLALKILVVNNGVVSFKHELYRRTIELCLSPLLSIALNGKVLDLFMEEFEKRKDIERIIHHAKHAGRQELVVKYAPLAAKNAAAVGAHIEAARLYLSALENYEGNDSNVLIRFYESYAYECYLTNKMQEAIAYTEKAILLWKQLENVEKIGNAYRFLSRLWWFDGNRKNAENFGVQAIELLKEQPSSDAKAMAFSNMSQLKMLSNEAAECVFWGEQAISIARELENEEVLCHALNNVGTVEMKISGRGDTATAMLKQSLAIALKNDFHEHTARAYTNLSSNTIAMKDYMQGKQLLEEGIQYCEEKDLNSWASYMLCWKAKMALETGNWEQAAAIADRLLNDERQAGITKMVCLTMRALLNVRTGHKDALKMVLDAGKAAFETSELQRIIPALCAMLEYEWITGTKIIDDASINYALSAAKQRANRVEGGELMFWLHKAARPPLELEECYEGYDVKNLQAILKAADLWQQKGCLYDQAVVLFGGDDECKRKALSIVRTLGAQPVYDRMSMEMRRAGIKNIPRGLRPATRSNSALLTERELDVLQLLKSNLRNKEIAARLFISAKTVDHHIASILFKFNVNARAKAVNEGIRLKLIS